MLVGSRWNMFHVEPYCFMPRNNLAAELGGLFINAKEGAVLRISLKEMGHPQDPTPMQTDNSTASGTINKTFKQSRYKAIDMSF